MPSFSGTLAATVTAVLYMTLCVGSQANSINAPVALLLPNGTIVIVPDRTTDKAKEISEKPNLHSCLPDVTRTHGGLKQANKLEDQRIIKQPRVQDFHYSHKQQLLYPNETRLDANGLQLSSIKNWTRDPYNGKPQNTIPKLIDDSKRIPEGVQDPERNTWDLIPSAGFSKFDRLTKLKRANVQIREFHNSSGSPYHSAGKDEMCCICARPKAPERDCSVNINNEQGVSKTSTSLNMPMPFKMHNKDISGKLCSFENISAEISEPNKCGNLNIKRHSENISELKMRRSDFSKYKTQSFPTLGDEETITSEHNRRGFKGFVEKEKSRGYIQRRTSNLEHSKVFPTMVPEKALQDNFPRCRAVNAGLRLIPKENANQRRTFKEQECQCHYTNKNPNAEKLESDIFGMLGTKIDEASTTFHRRTMEAGSAEDLKDECWQSEHHPTYPRAQEGFRNRGHFTRENDYVKSQRFRNAITLGVNSPRQIWKGLRGCCMSTDVSEQNNCIMAHERPLRVDVQSQGNLEVINQFRMGESSENLYHYCLGESHWENSSPWMEGTVPNFLTNGNSEMCHLQPGYKSFVNVMPGFYPEFEQTARFPNILPYFLLQNTNHLERAGRYESFTRPPNRNCECTGLGRRHMMSVPSNVFIMPQPLNSPAFSTNPVDHRLPWMVSPIHHPPTATFNHRLSSFLPGDSLHPELTSIASFVKDQFDNWWFIHYETVL